MAGQGSEGEVPRAAVSVASVPGAVAAEPEPLAHLQALIAQLRGALATLQKAKEPRLAAHIRELEQIIAPVKAALYPAAKRAKVAGSSPLRQGGLFSYQPFDFTQRTRSALKQGTFAKVFDALPADVLCTIIPASRCVLMRITSKAVGAMMEKFRPRAVVQAKREGRTLRGEALTQRLTTMLTWCRIVELKIVSCELRPTAAAALAAIVGKMPSLTIFDVSSNKIGGAGVKSIANALANCVGLKHLNLAFTRESEKWDAEPTAAIVELMGKLPSIAHLDLAGNMIRDVGSIAGALGNLPSLTFLDLSGNNLVTVDSARKLADALRHCDHLTHLMLATVFVFMAHYDQMEAVPDLLESIQRLPSLAHLHLAGNSFGDAAVERIALSVSQSTSIAHLDLSLNSIGDAGARRLAEMLQKCTSLKELKLQALGNNFGEESHERLEAAAAAAGVALRS